MWRRAIDVHNHPQHAITELGDAGKPMLHFWIDWIGLGHFRSVQCLFKPCSQDLPLLKSIPSMFRQYVIHSLLLKELQHSFFRLCIVKEALFAKARKRTSDLCWLKHFPLELWSPLRD